MCVDHMVDWVSDNTGVYDHLTASIAKKYLGSVKPTPSDSACEADGRAPTSVRDTLHSDCVICCSEKEIDNIAYLLRLIIESIPDLLILLDRRVRIPSVDVVFQIQVTADDVSHGKLETRSTYREVEELVV